MERNVLIFLSFTCSAFDWVHPSAYHLYGFYRTLIFPEYPRKSVKKENNHIRLTSSLIAIGFLICWKYFKRLKYFLYCFLNMVHMNKKMENWADENTHIRQVAILYSTGGNSVFNSCQFCVRCVWRFNVQLTENVYADRYFLSELLLVQVTGSYWLRCLDPKHIIRW